MKFEPIPESKMLPRNNYYLNYYCISGARSIYIFHTFKDGNEDTITYRLGRSDSYAISIKANQSTTCPNGMVNEVTFNNHKNGFCDLYYRLTESEYQLIMVGGTI